MANILLGINGSIAAYKIIELTHQLKQEGHQVKIILTRDAGNFVTKTAFAAFDAEVYTDDTLSDTTKVMQHIDLARWPDLIVIAPLSANTLSKLTYGMADNLLTATVLATNKPIYLVPAMNMHMWQNSIIQENISKLKSHGFTFWGPDKGLQACGDNGDGRMLEASEIAANIRHQLLAPVKLFSGKKVCITAGSTIEAIDPIRYISNHSSGKMAYALARAFASHGALVTLIAGNTTLDYPNSVSQIIKVVSAQEMYKQSVICAADCDIFISCAAVSDYRVSNYQPQKIKKSTGQELNLALIQNPDIITLIKQQFPNLYVAGFAAETENLIEYAKAKLQSKNLDPIIANDVSNDKVFGADNNTVSIIDKSLKVIKECHGSKDVIAHEILKVIKIN